MDYKALADVIRKIGDIELLIHEIESLVDMPQVETIDDLTEFLETELSYAD